MKFSAVIISLIISLNLFAKITISKSTEVVEHQPYSHFYQTGYAQAEEVFEEDFKDWNCILNLDVDILNEPKLFKKGHFVGSFEATCFEGVVSDINMFFKVYAYDEVCEALVDVTMVDGSTERRTYCWDLFTGRQYKCNFNEDKDYNFL